MTEKSTVPFTSVMSPRERAAALGYLPVHVYLLPRLIVGVNGDRLPDELTLNVVCYTAAAVVLLACLWRFSAGSSTRCATTARACCSR